MARRLIFLLVFVVLFSAFAFMAFKYEDEKSNAYYMKNGEEYALVAINTDELYVYGIALEDNLTVSNGSTYTSFENVKNDTEEAIKYLEYTFSLDEVRYLDTANPDYGSMFANYLVDQTEGSLEKFEKSLENLPDSYESGYNIAYLRLANLAHYNSEGYMDKHILTSVVNGEDDEDPNTTTVPVTIDMIEKVFYNIEHIEVTCDEQNICTYDEDKIASFTKTFTKLVHDNTTYITQYEGQSEK